MDEALIRVKAAIAAVLKRYQDEDVRLKWIRAHTEQHPAEFTEEELAALHLKCRDALTACVQPADVIALCNAVKGPSVIVTDLRLGCVRAAEAKEVHIGVRHLQHVLDSLPPPAPVPAPAPPPPAEAVAAEAVPAEAVAA